MKLLEAGQNEAGKSLVPKAIDADDDDGDASSDEDSDEVVCKTKKWSSKAFWK